MGLEPPISTPFIRPLIWGETPLFITSRGPSCGKWVKKRGTLLKGESKQVARRGFFFVGKISSKVFFLDGVFLLFQMKKYG